MYDKRTVRKTRMARILIKIYKSQFMKRQKAVKSIIFIMISTIFFVILSCEKGQSDGFKKLQGEWVSTDLVDTIVFSTDHDFLKNFAISKDHFTYSVKDDSMLIQYDGFLKILILPSEHYYELNGNNLTIDVRNCYGFRNLRLKFTKQ